MNSHKIGLFIASVLATAAAAAAEPQAASEQTEAAAEMPMVVVTGSSIPTTPDAVAVPVETLSAAQLQASGVDSNALEILRKEIPAFQGRSNAGTSNANNNNQNTAGGSQLQLRNLPTLVLVNGRRVATSGISAVNGKNFVDVNQIPAAAIDHVEVLTDGASSIYGSDAVGGVVNFILKSDYRGLTAGARAAGAADYGEWSAFATGGTPLGGGNITATLNYSHTDPLFQKDRSFSSPLYGKTSNLPGTVNGAGDILSSGISSPSAKNPTGVNATAPSLAALVANGTYIPTTAAQVAAGFDISPYQTMLLKQDLASFSSTFDLPLIDHNKLTLFGDAMVSQDRSWTKWAPVATAITVPVDAPYNPLTAAFPGVTFSYLPAPHDFYDTVTATRITAGLRGEFTRDWTWESALVYSESDLEQRQTNLLFKPNLARAIAGGFNAAGVATLGGPFSDVLTGYSPNGALALQPALDPFATAAGLVPGSLANLYGAERINAVSQLESWDGKIVGRLGKLPAGEVGLAVGATVRRELLSGHADANGRVTDPVTGAFGVNSQNWIGGTFADPFAAHRTISGAFVEVRVPITSEEWSIPLFRAFDLTAAERSEHYSDAGNSNVPKVGFRWQPFDQQLTLRGNYSKSFLAPNLFSEYGPTDTRQVGGAVIPNAFPGQGLPPEPFNGEDGNNPNLKPATSISRTVGFVLKPHLINNLSLTADYSNIDLRGFQAGIGFNNILQSVNAQGSASPYFANLAIGNFPGQAGASNPFGTPGTLLPYLQGGLANAANLYVIDRFQNNAELIEKSWTAGAFYSIPTARAGTFELGTTGSVFDSFTFLDLPLPSHNFIQYAGHATNAGVFGGTLPKWHFYTTLDWSSNNLHLEVANSYLSAVTDTGANGVSAPLPVSRYSAFDVRASYDWEKVTMAIGVNNVTNRMPPLAPRTFSDNNADIATYSPIGRLLYATVSVKL